MATLSGHMTFLFVMIFLCSTMNEAAKPLKRKNKYPFYRPQYDTTKSVFEPFTDAIQDTSLTADHIQLHKHLSNHLNPFISYHNYTQFMQEITHLTQLSDSSSSPWSSILSVHKESSSVDGNPLHRIILTDASVAIDNKIKILMIFGEHPREFIVSESMIDFMSNMLLSYLASTDIFSKEYVQNVLRSFEIHAIPILNPDGKIALETTGDYCWRWNTKEHRVDLNRNFDWFFAGKTGSTHKKGTEEWHGKSAFSEPEAAYLHHLLETYNYSVVLDIHSGTQQIFVPFVDSESRKTHRTRPQTKEELHLVQYIQNNSKGWFKNSGIAWKYNDYGADGTILDYVGGVSHVEYSLCAEIYGDPNVDNSIDCFVQFNPNNGDVFKESIAFIRTLYTGTFDYFLGFENRLAYNMMNTAKFMREYLIKAVET